MYRDNGTQVIEGRSYIPLIQGRCVGGSTVMNSAIVHRMPEDVLADWSTRFSLGTTLNADALAPHFDALERDLHASPVQDAALGENNRLFLARAAADGLRARRMTRYDRGCTGSGRCVQGCPTAAKQGMSVTYVPWALALGARIYCSCRVERVETKGSRAVGIVARTVRSDRASPSRTVRLSARRAVLVAASTVQTPNILRRSGVRSPALGRHFQCHPGLGVAGVFDDPVAMNIGATQGAESLDLRTSHRLKLETIAMPPELAAVRFPGVGHELMARMGRYANVALWAIVVRAEAEGSVRTGWGGRDRVAFTLSAADVERSRRGVALLARMMFQAGAREVWPGVFGVPSALRSMDDVRKIDEAPAESRAYSFIATHLFGAARMGVEPRSSVVGADFQCHEVAGLYVVDSSVFPTNLGVNPQHSVMAMSRLAAARLVATAKRAA
jgi:choline dehydrogenase-like flavoprotein